MKYLKRLLFKIFVFFFGNKEEKPVLTIPFIGVRIEKVLSITPGKNHAWVESSVGRIRKPIEKIPEHLFI